MAEATLPTLTDSDMRIDRCRAMWTPAAVIVGITISGPGHAADKIVRIAQLMPDSPYHQLTSHMNQVTLRA